MSAGTHRLAASSERQGDQCRHDHVSSTPNFSSSRYRRAPATITRVYISAPKAPEADEATGQVLMQPMQAREHWQARVGCCELKGRCLDSVSHHAQKLTTGARLGFAQARGMTLAFLGYVKVCCLDCLPLLERHQCSHISCFPLLKKLYKLKVLHLFHPDTWPCICISRFEVGTAGCTSSFGGAH